MTCALVSGYYGFGNAGDEAILAGLAEGFQMGAPQVTLTVLSGSPAATQAEHGVRAVPRGTRAARQAMSGADLFISGGGGLLQDATSWQSPLYYLWLLEMARRRGLPIACIGHSIGPLRRWWVRRLTCRVLNKVDVIGVRDHRSLQILQGLGLRRQAEITADLAFLLPRPSDEEAIRAWQKAGLSEKHGPAAAIAVRSLPTGDGGRGRAIAEAAIRACQAADVRPILIPMQYPADLKLAEEAAGLTGEVVRQRLWAREVLALISGFDLVLAMRLHALIFAVICALPVVAVSYDPKVDGLMAEVGLSPATTAAGFDPVALERAVTQVWRGREELARHIGQQAECFRDAALRNITLARQLLSG